MSVTTTTTTQTRILSIDIFRGLTIFAMVFVNDLAGVTGIPAWMKHADIYADTMTFVDVVFPAFLFIVGMSIPLAFQRRRSKGQSSWEIFQHVAVRTIGLLILGVYMVNAEEMNSDATLIPASIWNVLLYLSAIFIWNRYPQPTHPRKAYLYWGLRILGVIILGILWWTFRKGPEGNIRMTHSWWGILGLIGWAYLISMMVYSIFRDNLPAILGMLGLFTLTVLGLKSGELVIPSAFGWLEGQSGHFAHASLTLAGISLTLILQQKETIGSQLRWMLTLGLLCALGGFFVRPFGGISKNLATPSWVLYCIAICSAVFALIYWIVDHKGKHQWASFLTPAGKNPLLTYILPYMFYAAIGYSFLPEGLNHGFPGFIRSVVFSLAILGLSAYLTRQNIRLQL